MERFENKNTFRAIDKRIARLSFKYYLCHLNNGKMKRFLTIFALLAILLPATNVDAQVLSESAKRKFTVGVDVFTDIWIYTNEAPFFPAGFRIRTINQGANVFAMYNMQIGESLSSFSFGLAIRNHNLYSNSIIEDIKADTIKYDLIVPTYKRSKINVTYLDLPVEFKFRTAKGFKLGVGLKVGYRIDNKQLYVGDRPEDNKSVKVKTKRINNLEDWSYGATLRVGYKWISVFGYYQFSKIFKKGLGPSVYPVSLGITITPF